MKTKKKAKKRAKTRPKTPKNRLQPADKKRPVGRLTHMSQSRYRRYAEMVDAGHSIKDIAKYGGICESHARDILRSPHVKKYLLNLKMEWRERTKVVFEALLKRMEQQIDKGITETRVTYTGIYKNKKATITKINKPFTMTDLLNMMKIAGKYQPVTRLDIYKKTDDDYKKNIELVKEVEALEPNITQEETYDSSKRVLRKKSQ